MSNQTAWLAAAGLLGVAWYISSRNAAAAAAAAKRSGLESAGGFAEGIIRSWFS